MNSIFFRGDIVLVNFAPAREGEANFTRPAVIISNNLVNADLFVLVVIPLTSAIDRLYTFDLLLPLERTELDKDSKAQVNLIRHIAQSRLIKKIGFVPSDLMLELDQKIRIHLALSEFR